MGHGWRRIVALVALFSILGMLIAACGGGGDTGAEQGAATTEAGGAGATTEAGGGAETASPTEEPASAQTTEANETATAAELDECGVFTIRIDRASAPDVLGGDDA